MSALLLTIAVEGANPGKAIGVKEAIAMDLEKYGDVRVLRVEVQEEEQIQMISNSGASWSWRGNSVRSRTTASPPPRCSRPARRTGRKTATPRR